MRRFCVSVMKELNVMEKSSGYETLCSYDPDLERSPCRTWPRFPLCGWSPEQVTHVLIRVFNDSWLYLICELICYVCWLMCADCRRADDESLLVLSTWTHSRRQRSQHALWGEACLISSAFCHWVCVVVCFHVDCYYVTAINTHLMENFYFQNEIFASRHQDENSVACIEDRCYVLPLAQYCRWDSLLKHIQCCHHAHVVLL